MVDLHRHFNYGMTSRQLLPAAHGELGSENRLLAGGFAAKPLSGARRDKSACDSPGFGRYGPAMRLKEVIRAPKRILGCSKGGRARGCRTRLFLWLTIAASDPASGGIGGSLSSRRALSPAACSSCSTFPSSCSVRGLQPSTRTAWRSWRGLNSSHVTPTSG